MLFESVQFLEKTKIYVKQVAYSRKDTLRTDNRENACVRLMSHFRREFFCFKVDLVSIVCAQALTPRDAQFKQS